MMEVCTAVQENIIVIFIRSLIRLKLSRLYTHVCTSRTFAWRLERADHRHSRAVHDVDCPVCRLPVLRVLCERIAPLQLRCTALSGCARRPVLPRAVR